MVRFDVNGHLLNVPSDKVRLGSGQSLAFSGDFADDRMLFLALGRDLALLLLESETRGLPPAWLGEL